MTEYFIIAVIAMVLITLTGVVGDIVKTIYIGDKAEKVAKTMTDKVTRETELRIKRDFKRGIFD